MSEYTNNLPAKTKKKRYTRAEKAAHFAEKSRVGAVSNAGVPLSDFQRGRNFGRAEQINQERGDYKWRKSNKSQREQIQAERAAFERKQDRKRAIYFAKLEKREAKIAKKKTKR